MSLFENRSLLKIAEYSNEKNERLKLLEYSKNWEFWPTKELSDFLENCRFLLLYAYTQKELNWCGLALFKIEIDSADLIYIHVQKQWRKQLVASQLIERAHLELLEKSVASIVLEVRSGNLAAQEFYKKHNYDYIATRTKYYSDNLEDALIFRRIL